MPEARADDTPVSYSIPRVEERSKGILTEIQAQTKPQMHQQDDAPSIAQARDQMAALESDSHEILGIEMIERTRPLAGNAGIMMLTDWNPYLQIT